MFAQTLRVTVDLLLLRRGPQDLPSNGNLLVALGAGYFILAFAQVRMAVATGPALVQAILATGLLAAYIRAVLHTRGLPSRFAQTLAGAYAVGIVLTVLMLGPTAALAPFLQNLAASGGAAGAAQPPALLLLAYLVVGIWGLIAFGNIYRHALETSLGLGVLVALGFEFLLLIAFALAGPLFR